MNPPPGFCCAKFLDESGRDGTVAAWIAGGLARVLPYLAHGNAAAQAALLDHYSGCLDLTALDAAESDTPQHQVRA